MQSGSSSRSGRSQGAAVEADAIREQQPKRMQSGELLKSGKSSCSGRKRGTAVTKRIDTIGEQQLKRTQSGSSSSAQRAVWRRITHIGEQGEVHVAEYSIILVIVCTIENVCQNVS